MSNEDSNTPPTERGPDHLLPLQPVGRPAPAGPAAGTERTVNALRITRPWVRFLSIIGFIYAALVVVIGIVGSIEPLASGDPEALAAILAILLGIVYIIPCCFLFSYASRISRFLRDRHQTQLDAALEAQKSFWICAGVITLVTLCFSCLLLAIIPLLWLGGSS
jgi:uncharacterized membrane protein